MDERLESSLHNAVRLSLGMERRDSAVSRPYGRIWHSSEKPPEPLPAGTRVGDVFRREKRKLLILGEPGAGKTTTMLELARELLDAAKEDNTQPIPVLVSLSSWKQPEVGIFDWLVAELKDRFGLSEDTWKAWLRSGALLPLLDGLDEVTPQLQPKCAEAINTWLTGDIEKRPDGVLVCCRREEFEKIVGKKLSLRGAIYLQPLTAGQIEEYFNGLELSDVWQTVGKDAALQELLAKPLFLSMFGLVQVQGKFDMAVWQKRETSPAQIEYLFDTYWDAVMSRKLIFDSDTDKKKGWQSRTYQANPFPPQEVVKRTLIFIAKAMERDSSIETELLIENMQPSWLTRKTEKIFFALIWGLIWGIFLGLIGSLILGFILGFNEGLNLGIDTGLSIGIYLGIFLGIIEWIYPSNITIKLVEKFSILMLCKARQKIIEEIKINFLFGIIGGLLTGSLIGDLLGGLIIGLILGTVRGIVRGFIEGSKLEIDIKVTVKPNQGIKNSLQNMAIIVLFFEIITFLIELALEFLFPLNTIDSYLSRLIISVILIASAYTGFDSGGGNALTKHVALRIVLAWNRYVPLDHFDLLLDYCTERLLIQRIGGRYRFMHKLLQDYFAKMELD